MDVSKHMGCDCLLIANGHHSYERLARLRVDVISTLNGIIVTKDGFKATTIRPLEFLSLTSELDINLKIEEIDNSSIFYDILIR